MTQHAAPSLHQEMFENAVAALIVALARLPSRVGKHQSKETGHKDQDGNRADRNAKQAKN